MPAFAVSLVGIGIAVAWARLWSAAWDPSSFYGGDLIAYLSAAERLIVTGSPYSAELMEGPISNVVANVPIGYFYPPTVSQLFVPLVQIDRIQIAVAYGALQILALGLLLPRLVPPDKRSSWTALLAVALAIWFFPMQYALFGGNLSAVLAIGVALCLVAGTTTTSAVAAIATILKLTPAPLFLVALATRRHRKSLVAAFLVALSASVALGPLAWIDWIAALPNILRTEMHHGAANYSPAAIGESLGFAHLGAIIGYTLTAIFLMAGIRKALSQSSVSLPLISAAIGSTTFASPTLWDHYLAVLIPLNICGWYVATSPLLRPIIVSLAVVGVGQWVGLSPETWYRALLVAIVVLNFILLMKVPPRLGFVLAPGPDHADRQSERAPASASTHPTGLPNLGMHEA